jgi:L-ascorbate metabolism protein UlaG (beta-lactamase superfamily)
MKTIIILLLLIGIGWYGYHHYQIVPKESTVTSDPVKVTPIMHATAVLAWGDKVLYTDPVDASLLSTQPAPNIILVTDVHPDHLSTTTLATIAGNATIIAPQAVADMLPNNLKPQTKIMHNGDSITEQGISISAIPMYNLPEATSSPHTKGRGNGYVLEKDGYRVYIAGDTSGIPEMRTLTDIDMAFIPMNLPYTMDVDEAASAVLDFKPKIVYPYHYRGQNGLSDISTFKELVNQANKDIEVRLLNWYPTTQ